MRGRHTNSPSQQCYSSSDKGMYVQAPGRSGREQLTQARPLRTVSQGGMTKLGFKTRAGLCQAEKTRREITQARGHAWCVGVTSWISISRGCSRNAKENGSLKETSLFGYYSLSTCCVLGTVLGSGHKVMNVTNNIFALMEQTF